MRTIPLRCRETGERFESQKDLAKAIGRSVSHVCRYLKKGTEVDGRHYDRDGIGIGSLKTQILMCVETGETWLGHQALAEALHCSVYKVQCILNQHRELDGKHYRRVSNAEQERRKTGEYKDVRRGDCLSCPYWKNNFCGYFRFYTKSYGEEETCRCPELKPRENKTENDEG